MIDSGLSSDEEPNHEAAPARDGATRPTWPWVIRSLVLITAATTRLWAGQAEEWHYEKGYQWKELPVAKAGHTGFTLLSSAATGVTFTNGLSEEAGAANRVLWNGSGVALGDYDRDGLVDIFFCGLETPNALYRNLGNWRFTNVTEQAGLIRPGRFYRGAVFADVNGDGWLDLLISTTGQGVLCYLNDGDGHFTDVTAGAGTGSSHGSFTMALADVDGNGTLDLYIANYRTSDIRDTSQAVIGMRRGQVLIPPQFRDRLTVMQGRVYEFGEPDQLLLNDGKGHFTAASWTNGMFLDEQNRPLEQAPLDWGLTASFRDIDGDGAPDLYVCNDYWTPDRIWFNDGHGHFRAAPRLAIRHVSASSMGVDFADINRDGHLDFFVLEMLSRDHRLRRRQMLAQRPMATPPGVIENRPQIMRNTLFLNRGDNTFAEIADYAGVEASDWSWSPVFVDIDLDGYEDLLIVAGHGKDVQDLDAEAQIRARPRSYQSLTNEVQRQQAFLREKLVNARLYPRLDMPVIALRNLGNLRFEEMTSKWGTEPLGIHHGIALADLDGDGDLDFVVNNLGTAAGLYRNDSVAPRVAVRVHGCSPNTQAIGAKVKLLYGALPMQSQEVISGGRYLAGSDPMLVFAAGQAAGDMTLEVTWRSGGQTTVEDVRPNRLYDVFEPSPSPSPSPDLADRNAGAGRGRPAGDPVSKPLFSDLSTALNHRHLENPFDDSSLQPLLPRSLSQLGPGVAWADLNQDGHEDLVIGSGKGGALAVFLGDGKGHFKRDETAPFNVPVARDQTGIVIAPRLASGATILAGAAAYEEGSRPMPPIYQYDWGTRQASEPLPAMASSTGPLALADVDGDGDLELFVGGRVISGHWPEAASSQLYRNQAGRWILDLENTQRLERVGLVSGAVFSDLDGDGWPELLLACEWGPIHLFRNRGGQFQDETAAWGLDRFVGWWNGVTVGDLDGDGRMDIVASNWGLNSPYHASAEHPVAVYYGDLGGRGAVDLLEVCFDPQLDALAPIRFRDALATVLPWLPERFPTHKAYSDATAEQILGQWLPSCARVEATTLCSMVFLNRGSRFEAAPLPMEAQLAPAYAAIVADFDGDGFEDVFLSQNFFATDPQVARLDAGRGLLLHGDGTGKLTAVPGQGSGVLIYGEQRGAAVSDFNEDGRVDLAVTQNGATTVLLVNTGARPGLRVRLSGPPGNPAGVGATVRLQFGDRLGPAREVHAGSGYLSQDSAVLVLGTPQSPTGVWVRWPGGKTTRAPVPAGAREVVVGLEGSVGAEEGR